MELTQEEQTKLENIVSSKFKTIGRDEPQRDTLRHFGRIWGFQPVNLVETGTSRNERESPDGWGTVFLRHWADHAPGSKVYTVDISREHLHACMNVMKDRGEVNYVLQDSIQFLKDFPEKIHLLYLDSYDFDVTHECYQHQLEEIKAAHDKLPKGAVVVSDDNYKDDWTHGKGNYSIPWMLENGYKLIELKESQAILEKTIE